MKLWGTALDPRDGSVFIAKYSADTVLKYCVCKCTTIVEYFQVILCKLLVILKFKCSTVLRNVKQMRCNAYIGTAP